MMWLKTNPDGTPSVEGMTKPYCYHIDQFSELQPIIHQVIEYWQAMGLDMIQGDHEDAPGQLELNFGIRPGGADRRPPDHLPPDLPPGRPGARRLPVLHAQAVHGRVGERLPPQHLAVAGRREHVPAGHRQPAAAEQARPLARSAGCSSTCAALTAITAPTVNSYRRFWDTGFWAPMFADWGYQNRTTALRVSAPGRFEYRSVDSAVNPYLSMAGRSSRPWATASSRKLDPGAPEERNIYEAIAGGKQVKRIPMTLGEALDGARGGRGRPRRAARRDVPGLHALQDATSGSGTARR